MLKRWMIASLCTFSCLQATLDQFPTYQEAHFYHANSAQQTNVAMSVLRDRQFFGTETILELGSRSGRISAYIAGRVPAGSVVGLEPSVGMIEFAASNHSQSLYPNLTFRNDDLLCIDDRNAFDTIVSFSALHWVLDHETLLQKVYEALSPGGDILFTLPCKPSPKVAEVFWDVTQQAKWKTYLKDYNHPRKKFTQEEYITLLEQAGFVDVEVEIIEPYFVFNNKREFIDWYSAFTPMRFHIPDELFPIFMEETANRYEQSFPANVHGEIPFLQRELVVKARKPE